MNSTSRILFSEIPSTKERNRSSGNSSMRVNADRFTFSTEHAGSTKRKTLSLYSGGSKTYTRPLK